MFIITALKTGWLFPSWVIVDVAIIGRLCRLKNKPSQHILFSFHPASKDGPVLVSLSALSAMIHSQGIARWKIGMAFDLPLAACSDKQGEEG